MLLLVDNGASASITSTVTDFIDILKPVRNRVNRISGNMVATVKGTVRWKLEDDASKVYTLTLKSTYLVHGASARVLSLQHLPQQAHDNHPFAGGTGEFTMDKTLVHTWNQRRYKKTIPVDPKLNIGITKTAGGFKSFNAFMASQDATYQEITEMNIFETHVIPDLEDNQDDMCTYMLEMSKNASDAFDIDS